MAVAATDEKRSERLSSDDKTEVGSAILDPTSDTKPDSEKPQTEQVDTQNDQDTPDYPGGLKLVLILFSLCLAIFLVALDQTIIAPALGAITAEYGSVKDIVSLLPLP